MLLTHGLRPGLVERPRQAGSGLSQCAGPGERRQGAVNVRHGGAGASSSARFQQKQQQISAMQKTGRGAMQREGNLA